MKTTQFLSVLLTVIFIIVRFVLLTIAVVTVRPSKQKAKPVGFRRGFSG